MSTPSPVHGHTVSTFRKLAREAVIFMLLGLVAGVLVAFVVLEIQSAGDVKKDAAKAVYAYEAPPPPPGYELVEPVVQVPLTNGVLLFVTDCGRAHPADLPAWLVPLESASANAPHTSKDSNKSVPVPLGSTNGIDCVYFENFPWVRYGGQRDPERLGSPTQVAIEKMYWQAYAKSKREHMLGNGVWSLIVGCCGFATGLVIWLFYRLVRFAVKG